MHSELTDSELMFALAQQFETRRATDATIVRLIAEVTERSRPSLGRDRVWVGTVSHIG